MKVLFVCPFVPWPLETGGKIRTFHLIKEASAHASIHLRLIQEHGPAPEAERALAPYCDSIELFARERPGPIAASGLRRRSSSVSRSRSSSSIRTSTWR